MLEALEAMMTTGLAYVGMIGSTVATGIGAIAGGAVVGYSAAHGHTVQPESVDCLLTYGPAVANAALCGTVGGIAGTTINGVVSGAKEGAVSAALGGVIVGVAELVGFGAGYLVGRA